MGSVLNDIDQTLREGDIEMLRREMQTSIEDLIIQIINMKSQLETIENNLNRAIADLSEYKVNRTELDCRLDELHNIFKYRYEN